MAKSLILVLTPYEMEVVNHALEIAMKDGAVVKDSKSYRALVRVKDKVEQMLSETSKARS